MDPTAKALQQLDQQFADSSVMTPSMFLAKRAEIIARAMPVVAPPPADAFALKSSVDQRFEKVADFIDEGFSAISAFSRRISAKVAELEKRPAGIQVHATGDLHVEGMRDVSDAVADLSQILSSPIKPIYGPSGKLLGAQRSPAAAVTAPAGKAMNDSLRGLTRSLELANAKIAERDKALDSMERRLSRHADHLAHLETRLKMLERSGN